MRVWIARFRPFFCIWGAMWYVYICDRSGLLYTGITTDLDHRMKQHRARLLYSEAHPGRDSAVRREREIKGWRREKKLALIDSAR